MGTSPHDQANSHIHDYAAKIIILIHNRAMTKEFSSIVELKSIREQKSRLTERENELASPELKELTLIPQIYEWFKEILATRDCPPNLESVTQRKKFLFIVLFLFTPSTLAGGRLPNGVRAALAEVLPDVSPCVISNNISDILFIYQNYKDFRSDIGEIYDEILRRINAKG